MNIILCGLHKSGKTTIGKILACQLRQQHLDTDCLIVEAYKKEKVSTCREICLREGENYFRVLEKEAIASLLKVKNSVISLGGGSLIEDDNVKILQSIGFLIYLKTDLSVLWQRICQHGLPSYLLNVHSPEKHFYALMEPRKKILDRIAQVVIDTDTLLPEEIADKIRANWLMNYGK